MVSRERAGPVSHQVIGDLEEWTDIQRGRTGPYRCRVLGRYGIGNRYVTCNRGAAGVSCTLPRRATRCRISFGPVAQMLIDRFSGFLKPLIRPRYRVSF